MTFSLFSEDFLDSTRDVLEFAYDPARYEPLMDFIVTDFRSLGNFFVGP